MKLFLFIPFILITFSAHGKDSKRIEKSFDTNADGKIDFVEVIVNKIVIERKEDLNNDGVFDRQTLFYPETTHEYFKVIEEKPYGPNPRKRISYWHEPKLKKSFSLTQIDENNDGKWDKEIKSSSDMFQKKEECSEEDALMKLANTSMQAASLSDEYHQTTWGHQIHKSCLDNNNKDWFLQNTEKAIKGGMSCLEELGKSGGNGALKNHISLNNILQQNNVQIICNESSYDWGTSTIAHATTSSDTQNTSLKHPGISFNPASVAKYKSQGNNGENEFVRTVFHEQLHNLGYLHGHDIEYPYACEKCCFPDSSESYEQKNLACNICSGNYSGSTDIKYLRDITNYGISNYDTSHGVSTSIKYLQTKPGDIGGLSYLALNLSGVFDPVGVHLAAKIRSADKPDDTLMKVLDQAESYNGSALFKPYEASSKIIADAFYVSFRSGDPATALALLKKEAPLIIKEMRKVPSEEDSKYVADSLKAGIKKLVYTVWLDEYTGNSKDPALKKKLSDESYELVKLFNL
jgi:hypothetical protein